jgi:hypothetical protein
LGGGVLAGLDWGVVCAQSVVATVSANPASNLAVYPL